MKTVFVKETDNKGRTYIIEGIKKPNGVFSITRFICEVQEQETAEETQEIADMLLLGLNNNKNK